MQKEALYGLTELLREEVKSARLVVIQHPFSFLLFP
jgi:N-acetyl-gamma-glutamylphosphate reductase